MAICCCSSAAVLLVETPSVGDLFKVPQKLLVMSIGIASSGQAMTFIICSFGS